MRRLAAPILLIVVMLASGCGAATESTTLPAVTTAPVELPDGVAGEPATDEPTARPTPRPTTPAAAVPTEEPTPGATATSAAVPTEEPTPSATATPAALPAEEPTPRATATSAPTATEEPAPGATTTETPTAVPSPTVTPASVTDDADGPESSVAEDEGEDEGEPFQEPEDFPPSGYEGDVLAIRTSRGLVLPVRAATAEGYTVVTPCYQLATVSEGLAITGPVDILIDPGHGGPETGAVGPNGLKESTVNLQVAELLRAELIARGYRVELTRYGDEYVAIQARAELARAVNPTVFMSIHHNGGYPEPFEVAGTEVFVQYDDPDSARLGGLVFEEIQAAFAGIEADWMGNPDTFGVAWRLNRRGTELYGILRRTPNLVTVLTEAMFISTPAEAELLAQPEILALEAQALADALDRWFDTDDPGSGFVEGIVFQGDLGSGGGTQGCVDPPLS